MRTRLNQRREKAILLVLAGALVLLNLSTFFVALPETSALDSGCCTNHVVAKDFSSYFTAAWQLIHNPSQIYSNQNVSSLGIYPTPEPFKYLPSILFLIAPLTALQYHSALLWFDWLQFFLLIPIAFFIYKLQKGKNLLGTSILLIVAVLEPSPIFGWGFSATYYWQWAEGQTKVLLLFLLLLSFYLGKKKLPIISGIVFGYSFFDPRFALLSIPLFLMFNDTKKLPAIISAVASILVFNSVLLVPSIANGFLGMVFERGLSTPLYPYAFIPLLTIIVQSILNWREIYHTFLRIGARKNLIVQV
jgi:hypothetical protein